MNGQRADDSPWRLLSQAVSSHSDAGKEDYMQFLSRVTLITASTFLLQAAETPNTGMADPAALINAFDQYLKDLPANGRCPEPGAAQILKFRAAGILIMPLTTLRGVTAGSINAKSFNAGGYACIDLGHGTVESELTGLPLDSEFDLWLVDNRPSPGHSTLAEPEPRDVLLKVGSYYVESGKHKLKPQQFSAFLPDRAFVTLSGQSPLTSFVLTGAATLFDRLFRRQVRFVDDPAAAAGFDPG